LSNVFLGASEDPPMPPDLLSALTRMGSRVAPAYLQSPDRIPAAARREALDRAERLASVSAARHETLTSLDTPTRPTTARREYYHVPCQPMRAAARAFIPEHEGCAPTSVADRQKIMRAAEDLELATKMKGKKNGALGYIGLQILRLLMFTFANATTGLCCPSYRTLCKVSGLCKSAVSNALYRLECTGLLVITRRQVRRQITRISGITGLPETFLTTVQGSNLYKFVAPTSDRIPVAATPIRNGRAYWARQHARTRSLTSTHVHPSGYASRGENQTQPPQVRERPRTAVIIRHKTAADALCKVLKGWS
jgi:Helix-turn-helix domain